MKASEKLKKGKEQPKMPHEKDPKKRGQMPHDKKKAKKDSY